MSFCLHALIGFSFLDAVPPLDFPSFSAASARMSHRSLAFFWLFIFSSACMLFRKKRSGCYLVDGEGAMCRLWFELVPFRDWDYFEAVEMAQEQHVAAALTS